MENIIQTITIWIIPIISAIVIHEVSHGYVASLNGDNTAKYLGRLSLNPIKHIDIIGTIVIPIISLFFFNFAFGWAKPVPVNFSLLNNPKRDTILVALAGPFANFLMVIGWFILIKISLLTDFLWLYKTSQIGIIINLILGFFNLLPIPPLDGGRVLVALLPNHLANKLSVIEPYGILIVILLLVLGGYRYLLQPILEFASAIIL